MAELHSSSLERFRASENENPAEIGGVLSNSAFVRTLPGFLAGLLCLLARVLARLLTLLAGLVVLPALLRLALVVLIHVNLQISEI
jgi:hypothetical protein